MPAAALTAWPDLQGRCALTSGEPAADAPVCEAAGANQTLCLLANATCVWITAAERDRAEVNYELERWLPIAAILLLVGCPLLCWPVWCGRDKGTLYRPILADAPSINSTGQPITAQYLKPSATAGATLRNVSSSSSSDAAPAQQQQQQQQQQQRRWAPAALDASVDAMTLRREDPGRGLIQPPQRRETPPLPPAQPAAATPPPRVELAPQVAGNATARRSSPPTPPPRDHGSPPRAPSPAHSVASSINSDDFEDAQEHEHDLDGQSHEEAKV